MHPTKEFHQFGYMPLSAFALSFIFFWQIAFVLNNSSFLTYTAVDWKDRD